MIIDDITVQVIGGHGGDGAVAFNKNALSLGPAGASGGDGGNVYAEGVSDLSALNQFQFKKDIHAPDGQNGRSQFRDGTKGKDLIVKVPVGTVIHNLTQKTTAEIVRVGERIILARGGKGGRGNFHFRSSTNTSPREYEEGTPGDEFQIRFELKFIADVGLIGLPNVGKSNLLNILTNAKSKVANYPFTTLEPSLGVYYELIIADIPGLIEGASKGKGLGVRFLRHIERTHVLFHLIASDSTSPVTDYRTIRKEIGAHSKTLLDKKEYVFLSKSDNVSPTELKKKIASLKKIGLSPTPISILDDNSMEKVKKILNKIEEKKMGDRE